uniref:Uncharacterized protein n=1 Tax=Angiostrongylus cantonensis TaxID=6313 RepID=A0A0K0DGJ1_ANGCA
MIDVSASRTKVGTNDPKESQSRQSDFQEPMVYASQRRSRLTCEGLWINLSPSLGVTFSTCRPVNRRVTQPGGSRKDGEVEKVGTESDDLSSLHHILDALESFPSQLRNSGAAVHHAGFKA